MSACRFWKLLLKSSSKFSRSSSRNMPLTFENNSQFQKWDLPGATLYQKFFFFLRIWTANDQSLKKNTKKTLAVELKTKTTSSLTSSFVAWSLRSLYLSSSMICRRNVSLSCSIALSSASRSLGREIKLTFNKCSLRYLQTTSEADKTVLNRKASVTITPLWCW